MSGKTTKLPVSNNGPHIPRHVRITPKGKYKGMTEIALCPNRGIICDDDVCWQDLFTVQRGDQAPDYQVRCVCCDTRGAICDTAEDAIEAWNRVSTCVRFMDERGKQLAVGMGG